jgi:hypothetical protein
MSESCCDTCRFHDGHTYADVSGLGAYDLTRKLVERGCKENADDDLPDGFHEVKGAK